MLTVEAYTGNEDLFGKSASDLQTGVSFGTNAVTGTLKYVSDYTGFSGDPSLQSGNYIVFKATANMDDVTITAKMTNTSTLDSDGIAVFRVSDKDSQTLTVVAKKEGYADAKKVFSLSGLTCESQQTNSEPVSEPGGNG